MHNLALLIVGIQSIWSVCAYLEKQQLSQFDVSL